MKKPPDTTVSSGLIHQGLHLLAAYQVGSGVVLMQVAVHGHENEISAAPRVLERLDLQGKIITGDARWLSVNCPN